MILFLSVGVLAIAAYLTLRNLKNAPVGYEDETGFHAIRCRGCANLKEDGRGHQCSLGYPIRTGFLTGARPVDVCQDRTTFDVAKPASQEPAGNTGRAPNG
jgi:hypothetical protein